MRRSGTRYPEIVRAAAVRRYLTTDASYREISKDVGACSWTIRSWVKAASQADEAEDVSMKTGPDDRSAEEKLRLLLEVTVLSESERGEFLRRNGLRDGDLERWKTDAVAGLRRAVGTRGQSRRVRELERENKHQKKRLREAAALMDLQKKVHQLWEAEDDDIPPS
ncbi:MAG: transposase-like protein [Myxococcota bacterium]|jgi:transposase-like protein